MKHRNNLAVAVIINLVLFVSFYLLFGATFLTNDDVVMNLSLSGFWTPESNPFIVYTNIVIGYILSILFKIFPTIPWYTLNLIFILYLATSLLLYILIEKLYDLNSATITYLTFFIIVASLFLFFLQFTIVSSIAITTGFLILYYELFLKEKSNKIVVILSSFLIIWGSMLRFKSVFLAISLALSGIILSYIFIKQFFNKHNFKLKSILILSLLLSIYFLNKLNNIIYTQNPYWKKFLTQNEIKARLLDFNILEDNKELKEKVLRLNKWDKADYMLYRKRFFIDTAIYNINDSAKDLILSAKPVLTKSIINKRIQKFYSNTIRLSKLRTQKVFFKGAILALLLLLPFFKLNTKTLIFILTFLIVLLLSLIGISIFFKAPPMRVMYAAFSSVIIAMLILAPLRKIELNTKFLIIMFLITLISISVYSPFFITQKQ